VLRDRIEGLGLTIQGLVFGVGIWGLRLKIQDLVIGVRIYGLGIVRQGVAHEFENIDSI